MEDFQLDHRDAIALVVLHGMYACGTIEKGGEHADGDTNMAAAAEWAYAQADALIAAKRK